MKPLPGGAGPERRWPCVSVDGAHCRLRVVVVPQAGTDATVGLHDGLLRVRIAAPAVDGRANAALVAWIAGQVGLGRRDVELEHGASSRRKVLRLGCAADRVEAWLDEQHKRWPRR